ncbi:MAG: alpha/beta hydrolase-fold protein [Betaproteobacteria bacterium]
MTNGRPFGLFRTWAIPAFAISLFVLPGGAADIGSAVPAAKRHDMPTAAPASVSDHARVTRVVHFEIDMRAETAAGRFDAARDQVGVRGAALPLSWSQTQLAKPGGEGRYTVTVAFDRPEVVGQPLQYKFKIERPGAGANEGWEDGRNHIALLRAPEQAEARAFNSPAEAVPLERTGHIERIASLPSKFVESREIQVWLPPGYERDRKRRYPVLYLHDGQNVFDAAAAGAEWQFDETAQRLVRAGAVEPFIIVAVSATPARMDEYTPSSTFLPAARSGLPDDRRVGGAAPRYAAYLTRELKPAIDRRYRTRAGAAHTAIGGSSLGGLITMWLLLHHADVFGAGLVVSPSVWWDEQFIVRDAATAPLGRQARPRVWLDTGMQEGAEAPTLTRQLRDTLMRRGWNARTLAYLEQPDGTHDEASWALRVEGMLRFLYGRGTGARRRPR